MPRLSEINVRYRGGFRGSYIDISQLIDNAVVIDIIDFTQEESCVKNCNSYCRMQIRINGRMLVTWHSSEMLANFLLDCKKQQTDENITTFPIEQCIIKIGDDRAYYLVDAPDNYTQITDEVLDRMISKSKRNRR